ncbi:HD domain-containing phosphohydrolase [Telmatospirillum siberiense]|uniref:response regulator n=1 Tax=Telmatospirillum siberiense TaxID=382514 RepID=UPI0011AF86D0|nr:HD domain-containing phosphohydrolase [Telmatospirillum siberiense]
MSKIVIGHRANKPEQRSVAIVDGNQRHREQLSDALLSFYTVHSYADSTNALMGLGVTRPGLVLIGEYVPPSSGINFLRAMRCERELGHTPVVFVSDNGDPDVLAGALAAGANDCIIKPYRRSAMVKTISAQLNTKVERSWKELPLVARNALQDTLTFYNSIADIYDQSLPIQYGAVAESCSALVDAVTTNQFSGILAGVREHDYITYAHSLTVATLLALFGHSIGLPRAQQILLASGGLLHDVGKISIRHSILNKVENLTEEEWEIIRSHVPAAVNFLRSSPEMPKGVVTIAAQHHERLDGSGYPRGLASGQLNELARMSAIVDIFSSMTDHRIYKPKMTAEAVLKTMTNDMAGQIDQDLLARFREVFLDTMRGKQMS